jgi:membrane associated rhomboid family serine protease
LTDHTEVHRTKDPRSSREHALVLNARNIPFVHVTLDGQHVLAVPSERAREAREQLERYAEENANWPPRRREPRTLADGKTAALLYAATITAVYLLQVDRTLGLDWHDAGLGDAGAIRGGAWWRTVTPLTLHADLQHLASNLVFGVLFVVFCSHLLGTGACLLAVLASGALGNALSAVVQGPSHLFLGASTAVFGAIGLYMGFLWIDRRRQRYGPLHVWTPILCGVLFLGWWGMGNATETSGSTDETDIVAHVAGFVAGLAVGTSTALVAVGRLGRRDVQLVAGGVAGVLVVAAWMSAFSA